ncbi:MAG: hypothetical protein QOE92_197 [Chloroflexota bacterium]|jgi:dolichyl-phosphate beta-glucosyltransferase|nr:hypothetical protein [Chloroflexota bacterium]
MSDPATQPDLSVVVPAYNERNRLPPSLRAIDAYLRERGLPGELIVVDDGSSDGTAAMVEEMVEEGLALRLIRHPENRGKGAAVRTGMLAATGRLVLFTDADLSTPIADVERLAAALDSGADVAIGSRAVDRRLVQVHQPLARELMGRVFNLFVQAIVLPGLKDTQCGFKAFRGEVAHELFEPLISQGFEFDPEVLYRARRRGMSIVEIAVHWRNNPDTRVSPVRDSMRMFASLFRIRRQVT